MGIFLLSDSRRQSGRTHVVDKRLIGKPILIFENGRQDMHPKQVEAFKRMSPAKKLLLAQRLWYEALDLKCAYIRSQHPDFSEQQVRKKAREVFIHART